MEEYGHRCETRRKTAEQFRKTSFWCWLISLASCACTFESFRSKLCQFFKRRGYPDSAVSTGKRRALEIDRETALQTSKIEQTNRILFTRTYHPPNLAVKIVILKNRSLMIPKLNIYFLYHLLFHSNATKKIGNFLFKSATNRTLSNVHVHNTKFVLLCPTWLRSQNQIDSPKSMTKTLHTSPYILPIS